MNKKLAFSIEDLLRYTSSSTYPVLSWHYYSINLCERPLWMEYQVRGAGHEHSYNNLVIVSQCNHANLHLVHWRVLAHRKYSNLDHEMQNIQLINGFVESKNEQRKELTFSIRGSSSSTIQFTLCKNGLTFELNRSGIWSLIAIHSAWNFASCWRYSIDLNECT